MSGVLISVFLCVLACCFVGLRLLSLARRTRKLPDLYMGLGLLAFALAQVSRLVLGGLEPLLAPEFALGTYLLMHLGYLVAQLGLCLFTMAVFGPRSRWRWALVLGLFAFGALSRSMMTETVAPQLLSGASVPAVPGWDTASVVSFAMTFGWTAVESLRYHGPLRRRRGRSSVGDRQRDSSPPTTDGRHVAAIAHGDQSEPRLQQPAGPASVRRDLTGDRPLAAWSANARDGHLGRLR